MLNTRTSAGSKQHSIAQTVPDSAFADPAWPLSTTHSTLTVAISTCTSPSWMSSGPAACSTSATTLTLSPVYSSLGASMLSAWTQLAQ